MRQHRRRRASRRGRNRRASGRTRTAAGPDEITIDGETFEVYDVIKGGYLPIIEAEAQDFYVAENRSAAGDAARAYWRDMAEHSPEEFRAIMGDETLVRWALGQSAGPGSVKVNSLEEWLEVVADHPEEEFASYDGYERDIDAVGENVARKLGFEPELAYRHN